MEERVVELNFGPQHPATHGVLNLKLKILGDKIIEAEPNIGYLHRCIEKLCERRTHFQIIPLTNRADYVAALHPEHLFVQAVEKLFNIEPSERAQYLRVILLEFQRIASHLVSIGTNILDIGQMTTWFWCFRERELILNLLEEVTGGRLFHNFMRVGGLKSEISDKWLEKAKYVTTILKSRFEKYPKMIENRIFKARMKGVGVVSKEEAKKYCLEGPSLRGSGVEHDVRKDMPYLVYDKIDFDVIVEDDGDCFARYRVRYREMLESIKIIEECIKNIPKEGNVVGMKAIYFTKPIPKGEVYIVNEQARGEGGCYLVSNGNPIPYRVKFKAPSFHNVAALKYILPGHKIADVVAIIGSLDPVFGEVDR